MGFPVKICAVCGEEFELRPDKPGFANRCIECTESEASAAAFSGSPVAGMGRGRGISAEERKSEAEANAARRGAIRDLLYRKDS